MRRRGSTSSEGGNPVADTNPRTRLPVVVLVSTSAISHAGNVLTTVAVPWFVLQTTGSAARIGIIGAAIILPTIIAGLAGGALVDRLGHKRTSVLADLASGATVAMIPLLYSTVGIAFWQLLVLLVLSALLDVPGATARQSLAPELAGLGGYQLERVNSALSAATRAAQLVGPVLAGVLIAAVGAASVLWVNAVTFLLSAGLVALAIPGSTGQSSDAPATSGSYIADMLAGFRFIRADRLLLTLVGVAALLNVLSNPLPAVILPVYASEVFGGAAQLGLIVAAFGGGALAGSILFGIIGHRVGRRGVFIGAFCGSIVPYTILATMPGLLLTSLALVALGLMTGPLTPLFMTVLQERTPPALRGRIFGITMASVWIVLPLGMLAAGLIVERAGLGTALRLQVLAVAILAVGVLAAPALHELDNARDTVAEC